MTIYHDVRFVFWAVGLMVGAGIYALIGDIVETSGKWAPGMFTIAWVVMQLNGVALAGTVRRFPHAGSILAVIKQTTHPWVAVAFEILRLFEGGLALCVTSKLTTRFFVRLAWGPHVEPNAAMEICLLIAVAFVLYRGIDSAMDLGNIGTVIEVSGLLLVIGAAVILPTEPSLTTSQPVSLSMRDATVSVTKIVFAYGGIQGLLDVAGDLAKADDEQDVDKITPHVVTLSIAVTGLMYTSVCCAAISMVGADGLTKQAVNPLGMVLETVGFPIGTEATLTLISLISVGNTCVCIFTFVSRIALSLVKHVASGYSCHPSLIYLLMVGGAAITGQLFDIFALAERVGVMLLITFAVLDYAYVTSIAQSFGEKACGSVAFACSCGLVIVELFM